MVKCIERAESHCRSYPRCDGCGAYREPTNADRIRAMSDEALAAFLYDDGEAMCKDQRVCSEYGCKDCILDWLKQPVKDGE